MALPEIPKFESLLGSVRLVDQQPLQGGCRRLPSIGAKDENGRLIFDEALWLAYDNSSELQFDALVRKVTKELSASTHVATDDLALLALALAFLVPAPAGAAVARANRLLSRVRQADVTLLMWFALPMPAPWSVEIPPFYVGPTRTEKLRYRCERAGSDYHRRYADAFKGTFSIEREPKKITVLDVEHIQLELFKDVLAFDVRLFAPRLAKLFDGYFGFLGGALFEDLVPEMVACQDVCVALGAPFLDPRAMLGVVGFQQVAIFLNFGKFGFVAPRGPGVVHFDWANAHVRVPVVQRELKESFGYDGREEAALHATIALFCSFVARAKRHWFAGRLDEALLHAVIAMELVFAERARLQGSVSERVAVLTHGASGRTFAAQRLWVEEVYDTRSTYVHAGRSNVQHSQLQELFGLCALLARRLLRTAQRSSGRPDALAHWLAELDYLAKAQIAGKTPSAGDLAAAFLEEDAS